MIAPIKTKRTSQFNAAFLHHLLAQNKVLLNPAYQRQAVWTRSQQQLLIDSLLNDLDIPKLYFREVATGSYEYEVVDGQQRLRAIFDFLENQLSLPRDADQVDGHEVAGKIFKTLSTELQRKLSNQSLDVVVLSLGYSDENVEDMFQRLQNGTPLNAAEKRRAYPGNMKLIVQKLAKHKVFKLCAFTNRRFAHEDAGAKILHLMYQDRITDIKPSSLRKTYEANLDITEADPLVKKARAVFQFLVKAFQGETNPELKKYSIISLCFLAAELLSRYDISSFPKEFARCYLEFEKLRLLNEAKDEEDQDPSLAAYTDAARSDSIQDLNYRHELLRDKIVSGIPDLALKDPTRGFSREQRLAIFLRDDGICQDCRKKCNQNEFHADHRKPHARGGKTMISNGCLLCPECNYKKGAKLVA
ncbi:MAG: DUF262 domain-containing protein [Verrucomicrobiae bacterium]